MNFKVSRKSSINQRKSKSLQRSPFQILEFEETNKFRMNILLSFVFIKVFMIFFKF